MNLIKPSLLGIQFYHTIKPLSVILYIPLLSSPFKVLREGAQMYIALF